ncbi:hypothetical protein ACQ4M4_10850 [Leptolyngbya sp. AN02str]|uniref:hypothetical protein n=1 Tax=Leptolyngbya sp. AN02str TaxID=3423363 RepID=UPI003D318390
MNKRLAATVSINPERKVCSVGGDKGGVGKSFTSCVMAEFCLAKELEFVLAECDRVNPDVGRIYRNSGVDVKFAYFSEDPRKRTKADTLFKAAIDSPLVICNLPAQVHQPMKEWFLEDDLYELAQEHNITFYHWYVTNGGYDSVKLFLKSLKELGPYMKHIFVRNWGLCDSWTHVDEDDEVQAAITEHHIPVIDLPKFPYAERNLIEEHQLTFTQALQHPKFDLVSRQRVYKFLQKSFTQIESTGILSGEKP